MNQTVREICDSCLKRNECSMRRRASRPIERCDFFESKETEKLSTTGGSMVRNEGICGTCSKKDNCKKRLLEGVIWRCTEYE